MYHKIILADEINYMSPARPLKVFLCHARADQYAVRWLYYYLVDLEIDAWLDVEKLLTGQEWEREIPKAIRNSDAIILCLSKDSINREGYIQKEIRYALDKAREMPLSGRLFLIPVRLDDYDILPKLSEDLAKIQYVDLFEESGCIKLLQSLQNRIREVEARPIEDSMGGSMREKTKQLAKMITREMRWKEKREQNPQMQMRVINKTPPVMPKLIKQGADKISAWSIGTLFTILFALLALTISWVALSTSLQSTLTKEPLVPVSKTDMPTFASVTISSVTEDLFGYNTPTYIPTSSEETSTQVFSTQIPPTQVPPTQIPPTPIPPTQVPPTQIPPTLILPTFTPIGGGTGKIAFASDQNGNFEIFVMNADGSGQINLTNNSAIDSQPSWSPDGRRIAFASTRDGSNYEIYVMNADGNNPIRLTNNSLSNGSPSWSPDGGKIVFYAGLDVSSSQEIYAINADGSGQIKLTQNSTYDFDPSWSPDGTKIAFCSGQNGNPEIYVMNADGSGQINLTNSGSFDYYPKWSPDGRKIAFVSYRDGNLEIYVLNADGSGLMRLTQNSWVEHFPSWSPDGRKIVFISSRDDPNPSTCAEKCTYKIYMMNADGSGQIKLANYSAANPYLSWSP